MVMVRTHDGIQVDIDSGLWTEHSEPQVIFAFFFLASPEEDAGQHLRLLAQIAQHTGNEA